ncbi:MAG: hypothetical protein ACLPLP_13025, partial [Mycobacterium sp.]
TTDTEVDDPVPDQIHPPHQTLFNAATIGNVDLANRVALAPMTRVSATADGLPTDRIASYYRTFAQGGFALLITEGLYIDDARAPGLCSCCPLKLDPPRLWSGWHRFALQYRQADSQRERAASWQ